MGRSLALFQLSSTSPQEVLATAQSFASAEGLRIAGASPNQILLVKGIDWVAGQKNLNVSAWPAQGGTNVRIEAWYATFPCGTLNADPEKFAGGLLRRDLWKTLCALLTLYGIAAPRQVVLHF